MPFTWPRICTQSSKFSHASPSAFIPGLRDWPLYSGGRTGREVRSSRSRRRRRVAYGLSIVRALVSGSTIIIANTIGPRFYCTNERREQRISWSGQTAQIEQLTSQKTEQGSTTVDRLCPLTHNTQTMLETGSTQHFAWMRVRWPSLCEMQMHAVVLPRLLAWQTGCGQLQ